MVEYITNKYKILEIANKKILEERITTYNGIKLMN
jgi:hypothetical protein